MFAQNYQAVLSKITFDHYKIKNVYNVKLSKFSKILYHVSNFCGCKKKDIKRIINVLLEDDFIIVTLWNSRQVLRHRRSSHRRKNCILFC